MKSTAWLVIVLAGLLAFIVAAQPITTRAPSIPVSLPLAAQTDFYYDESDNKDKVQALARVWLRSPRNAGLGVQSITIGVRFKNAVLSSAGVQALYTVTITYVRP